MSDQSIVRNSSYAQRHAPASRFARWQLVALYSRLPLLRRAADTKKTQPWSAAVLKAGPL
jgi:hypothetical protein